MYIRNKRELRIAYQNIELFKELMADMGGSQKASDFIIETKKAIRKYNKKTSDRRVISGDIDGYVELIELPGFLRSVADAEDYFENNERLARRYSAYDCTGDAFTSWYKIFIRRGRFMAYHSVGIDV